MRRRPYLLGDAFEYFIASHSHSKNTRIAYGLAARRFFQFLETSPDAKLLSLAGHDPASRPLHLLGGRKADVEILRRYVNYLRTGASKLRPVPGSDLSIRRLSPAAVHAYSRLTCSFFAFMHEEGLLPDRFPASLAIRRGRQYLASLNLRSLPPARDKRGVESAEMMIRAIDRDEIRCLSGPHERRYEIEALRNRALVYALAASGGTVSEVLLLNAEDVRDGCVNETGIWTTSVHRRGQASSKKTSSLRFTARALQALKDYVKARGHTASGPLFVRHTPGPREACQTALGPNEVRAILNKLSRQLSLPHVHPQDFRTRRAIQMLRQGVAPHKVQVFLNHQIISSTLAYFESTDSSIDEAFAAVGPY